MKLILRSLRLPTLSIKILLYLFLNNQSIDKNTLLLKLFICLFYCCYLLLVIQKAELKKRFLCLIQAVFKQTLNKN